MTSKIKKIELKPEKTCQAKEDELMIRLRQFLGNDGFIWFVKFLTTCLKNPLFFIFSFNGTKFSCLFARFVLIILSSVATFILIKLKNRHFVQTFYLKLKIKILKKFSCAFFQNLPFKLNCLLVLCKLIF